MATLEVTIPFSSEVLEQSRVLGVTYENPHHLIITLEPKLEDQARLHGLEDGIRFREIHRYTIDVQELGMPHLKITYQVVQIVYRYKDGRGHYHQITTKIPGMHPKLKVTDAVLRKFIEFNVKLSFPLEICVCLLRSDFSVWTSLSGVDRWKAHLAKDLPTQGQIIRKLNAAKPIRALHMDEFKAKGGKGWQLVLRDEHDRVILVWKLKRRTEKKWAAVLRWLRMLGLEIRVVYVDFWKAYPGAIRRVFPQAILQYDYFHTIQNIYRYLYQEIVAYRKRFKNQKVSPQDEVLHQELAKKLWKNRYKVLKQPERLSPKEKQVVDELLQEHQGTILEKIVRFRDEIQDMFKRKSLYYINLARLDLVFKGWDKVASCFKKCLNFIQKYFREMISYLRYPKIQRNSLQETTIRTLRKVEAIRYGFKSDQAARDHWKFYQIVHFLPEKTLW